MENATQSAPFVSRQRIYFDMLDSLGVMHNSRYLLLFERARFDLWHANGLAIGTEGLDFPYYVVRNEVNYRAPITRLQEVTVEVMVEHLGTTSVILAHQVCDETGLCVADGKRFWCALIPKRSVQRRGQKGSMRYSPAISWAKKSLCRLALWYNTLTYSRKECLHDSDIRSFAGNCSPN